MAIPVKQRTTSNVSGSARRASRGPGREARSRGIRSAWRQSTALILVALLSCACAPVDRAQTEPPGEYQLKAAFLFNFAKFIDWPTTSFSSPQSPFSICILGTDPFGHAMDDVLRDKSVDNRPVAITRLKSIAQAKQCHMVVVSQSETAHLADVIQQLRGGGVLLVGESDGFAAAGGMIQFTREDNHVRFLINPDAADRAGLKVSSKLLSLARVVHDAPKNDRS
jgi:hypothetical protein